MEKTIELLEQTFEEILNELLIILVDIPVINTKTQNHQSRLKKSILKTYLKLQLV